MIPPVLISPPFGNYLNRSDAISVLGSFTAEPRKSLVWNTLKSLRKIPGGWVNRIGLRNIGIRNIKFQRDKIYSLAPLRMEDYADFLDIVPAWVMIEINLGCPNTDAPAMMVGHAYFEHFVRKYPFVSVKLPPTPVGKILMGSCYRAGVRYFHLCNTIPTMRGGESGARLRARSLEFVDWTRDHMPSDIRIIGGGGIYEPAHVLMYRDAGANHISLSTACFTPWKLSEIIEAASNGKYSS